MSAIKIYFDSNFQLIDIDSEVTLVQGDTGSKDLYFYFADKNVNDYGCRIIFERPDGSTSNEVYASPVQDGYYKTTVNEWITEFAGTLKLTARLKQDEVIEGFGLVTLQVAEGVTPTESTIEQENYQDILDELDSLNAGQTGKVDKTQTIADIDLEDNISKEEMQEALEIDLKVDKLQTIADVDLNDSITKEEMKIALDIDDLENEKVDKVITIAGVDLNDNITKEEMKIALDVDDLENNKVNKTQTIADIDLQNNITKEEMQNALDVNDKVDKILTIIGIDLQNDIDLNEFKIALGNATQLVAGLMSSSDKTKIDTLYALLGTEEDADVIVNTLNEVFAIFENYPEGVDLVGALELKVSKVEGKGLSTNDLTDALKDFYDTAYSHSQVIDANPHEVKFSDLLAKPTTLDEFGITDAYEKVVLYTKNEIDALINGLAPAFGLQSSLLTPTDLSDGQSVLTTVFHNKTYAIFVATNLDTLEIDSDVVMISSLTVGKKLAFFDDANINFEVGLINSTFNSNANVSLRISGFETTQGTTASEIIYDNVTSELIATNVQTAIDEIVARVKALEEKIDQDVRVSATPTWQGIKLDLLANEPTYEEGTIYWDKIKRQPTVMLANSNVRGNVLFEMLVMIKNTSARSLVDGDVVYPTGYFIDVNGTGWFEVGLANSNTKEKITPIAVVTSPISQGEFGYATKFGLVGNVDTSGMSVGDKLYVSGTTDGAWTTERPLGGSFPTIVGFVVVVGTEGVIQVDISETELTTEITNVNGFARGEKEKTSVSFVNATRVFTIAPLSEYHFYHQGIKYEINTTKTITISDIEGIHFIYYDEDVLKELVNPDRNQVRDLILNDTAVAVIYWDFTNKEVVFGLDERHGIMDSEVHYWAHIGLGTLYLSGIELTLPNVDENSVVDNTAVEFAVSEGFIKDEDIEHTIIKKDLADNIKEFYFDNGGYPRRNTENAYGLSVGANGRLNYNMFDGSAFSKVECDDNTYVYRHIIAIPSFNKTVTNYISFMGNGMYDSINDAEAGVTTEKALIESYLPSPEMIYSYSILYQTRNVYSNTYKARIVSLSDDSEFFDFRTTGKSASTGSSVGVTSHIVLTDRDLPNAHPAEAISYDPTESELASTNVKLAIDEIVSLLNGIFTILSSDDGSLDTMQEIVNYIKANKDAIDNLGISDVSGLQTALDGKVDDSQVLTNVPIGAVFTDTIYTLTKVAVEGVLTGTISSHSHASDWRGIVNDLTTGGTTVSLSAEQGKVLKGYIDNINTLLLSDEITLDTLQEIVDFIQTNKSTLDTLGISNISGLQSALDGKEPSFSKNSAFNKNFGTTVGTVVQGNDARMSDARPASDVYTWAKASVKPSYNASEVGLGNVTNESKATMFTSPAFTGTPTAPTPATADNTTKVATTAFVKAQAYAPIASPTFTGTVVAPTNTAYTTRQVRNVIISTADPSGGSNGDIWIKYTA